MNKSITAIIPSFRRHANLPIMIKRIKNQTYPPERIIIWNDNNGPNCMYYYPPDNLGVEIINTNSNWWSNYGSYLIGYLTNTDYIAILDDDMPPGPKWFEFCIRNQETTPGLYCKYGVVMNGVRYSGNDHFSSVTGDGSLMEVDMVGNSYFVPYNAINCMLFERPPTFEHTCDLHLSFMAQKYGGLKCYVPFPKLDSELPYYKPEELPLSKSDRAMYNESNHYINRNGYVRWAVKNGWKLLKSK